MDAAGTEGAAAAMVAAGALDTSAASGPHHHQDEQQGLQQAAPVQAQVPIAPLSQVDERQDSHSAGAATSGPGEKPIQPIIIPGMVASKALQQDQDGGGNETGDSPPATASSQGIATATIAADPAARKEEEEGEEEKRKRKKKKKQKNSPQSKSSSSMPAAAADLGAPQVGTRIAKIFPGWGLYVGQVVTINDDTYHVRYEDGEEEVLERKQVEAGQKVLQYAEAEITTQARNSRLRLREQGLLTEGELRELEMEEEMAEQERKASKVAATAAAATAAAATAAAATAAADAPIAHMEVADKEKAEKKEEENEHEDNEGEVVELAPKPKRKRKSRAKNPKEGGAVAKKAEPKSPSALPTCKACGCTFTSEHGLKYHQDKAVCITFRSGNIREADPGEEIPPCPFCQRTFPSPNCLRYHLERSAACGGKENDERVMSIVTFHHKAGARKKRVKRQVVDLEGGGGGEEETVVMTKKGGVPSRRAAKADRKKTAKGKRRRAGADLDDSGEENDWSGDSEKEEEDEQDVSADDSTATSGGGGGGGGGSKSKSKGGKRARSKASVVAKPRLPLQVLKGKCRLDQSNVRLVLPGLEGTIYTGFPPSAVEGGAIEAGLETDLSGLRQLVAGEQQVQQQAREMALDMWMMEHGVEVGPLPLRIVGPEKQVVQMEIPPFQGLLSPFSQLVGGAMDTLVNAGGPVQSLDMLTLPSGNMYAAVGTSSLAKKAASATDMDLFLTVPGTPTLHVKGRPTHGPNLLQIWDMAATPAPRMTYAVGHSFGAVWGCRWLPSEQLMGLQTDNQDVLGALLAVFGDGKARIYLLPTPTNAAEKKEPTVLHLAPLIELEPPVGTCLTCARVSPHDPGLVLCGATNGMALLYSMDTSRATKAQSGSRRGDEMEEEEEEGEHHHHHHHYQQKVQVLKPVRRFFDGRENTTPILSAVDVVEWHPTQPQLFLAGGHDYNMRLWDMKKPFRPLLEKGLYRYCHAAAFLPNGVGCLGGFTNGAVRVLGLPEDVARVRLYRHEASVHDGVAALDSLYSTRHACVVVASTGADGKFAILLLDKDGLVPRHYRPEDNRDTSHLLTLMNLQAPTDEALAATQGGGREEGRLTCELLSLKAGIRGEGVEVSPSGKIERPVRAGLAATRVVLDAAGEPFAAVGGFSGLCRFVSLKHLLP